MIYNKGKGEWENWLVSEPTFESKFQGKCESIFCLGNGYIGWRSATEERYVGQVRDLFVAGTFNKAYENEVTELPNAADMGGMDIFIDGELFSLEKGSFSQYHRTLNLKTGELVREFEWTNSWGKRFEFSFKRFVSHAELHLMATALSITPLDESATISIKSGIDGQVTNTGAQHFVEGEKRIFDNRYLQLLQKTNQSGIEFVHNTVHNFPDTFEVDSRFEMDRRKVLMIYEGKVGVGQSFSFDKISNLYTTRDQDTPALPEIQTQSIESLKEQAAKGYEVLLQESIEEWGKYWEAMDILVESDDPFDQLAIRFAQYHLLVMTPKHDPRCGIGAKGLSGEGYKGHSFWDTEIFILPFYAYTFPEIARKLLEYRYITIGGARQKAIDNGYKGAMYPWESAWVDDGEVTPVWGAADIVTGEATKIWSGFIEQHITSDVAFAIWQYYMISGDEDYMEKYGYEILLDIGIFWGSRLEWDEELKEYHINDVVGPDEYKEHVNNDAFTNHTAKWCMENALHYYQLLKSEKPKLFERLNDRLNLDQEIPEMEEKMKLLFLPQPNEDLVIPQDDTYLQKELIDLTRYKKQKHVGSIFRDFNLDQVNEIQVSKQAAVVMLMYLLEHKFSPEIKEANYNYYEPKTLHDSSLSLSTHATLAADLEHMELAYDLFQRAARIDLGPNMKSSDHGMHAASLGGVWQIIVCGFGGVRMIDGELRIDPKLPEPLQSITYPIIWKGNRLVVTVSKGKLNMVNQGAEEVSLTIFGQSYTVANSLEVNLEPNLA